ncbi:MAG: hypothetical protein J0L74_10400, partial [Burkholderiales bacterium]|nr:hypothetical protein [Burkholderiales bacterium]
APISPLAEYALYPERGYQWNPQGTGLSSMAFPFPVFLLDNDTTASAQLRAQYNADRVGPWGGRERCNTLQAVGGWEVACTSGDRCYSQEGRLPSWPCNAFMPTWQTFSPKAAFLGDLNPRVSKAPGMFKLTAPPCSVSQLGALLAP